MWIRARFPPLGQFAEKNDTMILKFFYMFSISSPFLVGFSSPLAIFALLFFLFLFLLLLLLLLLLFLLFLAPSRSLSLPPGSTSSHFASARLHRSSLF